MLAFVPASWALDEPPRAPNAKADSPRARLEVIQREYAQAQRASMAAMAAYRKATTDDERKKAVASRPDAKKYVARMMELAESAPDDPAAVDALLFVVNHGGQTKEVDRAIERLARDHAQDPEDHADRQHARPIAHRRPASACCAHRREEPRSRRTTPGLLRPRPVAEQRGRARPPDEAE